MRIAPLLLVALLVGSSFAVSPADACGHLVRLSTAATGTVRWTWGPPGTPTIDQDFTGPGLYTQTISVEGLSGTYGGLGFFAEVTGEYPAAWSMLFVTPYADCQGRPAVSATPVVAGTETVPGAVVTFRSDMPLCWPPTLFVNVTVTFDPPFTFDPEKRYGLATLGFDHSASVVGTGDAAHCGGAEVGLCFELASDAGALESPLLTWQGGREACAIGTPAHTSTWGALKQIYR